jgi:glycosyltransferase involved in cell wall biosynthesis
MYVHRLLRASGKISAFIAPSIFLRAKMIEYGIEPSKVYNIPSFLTTTNYKEHYGNAGYILYVGMILKYKGVGHLIRAFEKIEGKGISLKIAGSSSDGEKERLEKYVLKRNVKSIQFLGQRTGEELADLYQQAMFVVCPSTWYENMPNVIIESMAYGKPVLGSNIGSIPELIEDSVDGMLFKPGDSDDLAEKIKYLLNNQAKICEMGKRAREKAEQKYNQEIHYQKLMGIFERVLHG